MRKNKELSPQKELLVSFLRDYKWHCASEWANKVKDDRTRFCELEPYMAERGYRIASEPCRGSVCGRRSCPLNKRQAVKIQITRPPNYPPHITTEDAIENERLLAAFDAV